MAKQQILEFSVSDKVGGHEVTPDKIPLGLLKDFIKDVAVFVRGDKQIDIADLIVSVKKGSLTLQSHDPLPKDLGIWQDIEQLEKGFLDRVDPKRVQVAEKWRDDAFKHPGRTFRIGDAAKRHVVLINDHTFFKRIQESNWVQVERYISGIVEDWGGKTSANIHLRLDDDSTLTIDATKDQIRDEDRNPVYRSVIVRVEIEENLSTGERRNAKFISFADYGPRIDEGEYSQATKVGRRAWSDVKDPVKWVREIRGDKE